MTQRQDTGPDAPNRGASLSEAEKRRAISKVLTSGAFASSPRLRDFLKFVAEESLRGRTADLRAKSIAYHVYGRDGDDEMASANVVRVEARRLRRLLEDYYEGEGANDPIRVHIDKGGYAPRFEGRATTFAPEGAETEIGRIAGSADKSRSLWLIAGGGIALAAVFLMVYGTGLSPVSTQRDAERLEREALMDQSPAALEAANLTSQARGLIFPVFDAERQRLTTELFRSAIKTDPNAAGAYAGAAQTLASLSLLSPDEAQRAVFLGEARRMLDEALRLAPSDAWTQSAAGWLAFVSRDYDEAIRLSERAVSLDPDDPNVLDFYGVIAVLSGEYEKAIEAAEVERVPTASTTRFASMNILGAAQFHTGNYEAAARTVEKGNAEGGPLSAPGVIYLAAIYQALGRTKDGERMIAQLEEGWPGFPVEAALRRMHRHEDAALDVVNRLRALNWDG